MTKAKRYYYTQPKGDTHHNAVLTEADAAIIKRRLLDIKARRKGGGVPDDSIARIAAEFGVHVTTIYAIRNKVTWREVEPAPEVEI